MASKFVAVTVIMALLPNLQQVEGINCFHTSSSTITQSSMPGDAIRMGCDGSESFCSKTYKLTITKENGKETNRKVNYAWGCFVHAPFPPKRVGGNVVETGIASGTPDKNVFHYTRTCLCDSDNCNGGRMDRICNEEPTFTHQCYSDEKPSGNTDPHIPANPVSISCTAEQSCYKYSKFLNESGQADYKWGCMTTSKAGQCDHSSRGYDGKNFEKVCMCCGNLCNNQAYDLVTVNNSECISVTTTTPAQKLPSEGEKQQATPTAKTKETSAATSRKLADQCVFLIIAAISAILFRY